MDPNIYYGNCTIEAIVNSPDAKSGYWTLSCKECGYSIGIKYVRNRPYVINFLHHLYAKYHTAERLNYIVTCAKRLFCIHCSSKSTRRISFGTIDKPDEDYSEYYYKLSKVIGTRNKIHIRRSSIHNDMFRKHTSLKDRIEYEKSLVALLVNATDVANEKIARDLERARLLEIKREIRDFIEERYRKHYETQH